MTLPEQTAHEEAQLREVLEVRGIVGVIDYCVANPSETLGVANTALVRGALAAIRQIIMDYDRPTAKLATLLTVLSDGVALARPLLDETQDMAPHLRLTVSTNLSDVTWRLASAATAARQALLALTLTTQVKR